MLFENCEKCETQAAPIKTPMIVYGSLGGRRHEFTVSFLRFHCTCGWIWATEDQRKYNENEYNRVYHDELVSETAKKLKYK